MRLPTPVADHRRDRGVAARVGDMMGERVMEALATLDQVAFNRSSSVYRNFREAVVSQLVPLWRGGWLIPNGNHSLPGFGPSLPSL